jgi:glycosyltransferase involved in cell wall biosynthesis
MLTVLQIIPALDTGGAERTTIDVAGAIIAGGGRALVVSEGGRLESELSQTGAELIRLPVASKNPLTMLRNAGRLKKIIRERKVSVIHARSRAPAWSARLAARAMRIPFLTTYHGAYRAGGPLKKFYNSIMASGDLVIANSQYTADQIAAAYKTKPEKLVVIPRGTDFSAFDPERVAPERVTAVKTAWGLGAHDGAIVLLPGRLTRWKGQLVLVAAFRLLKEEGRLGSAAAVLAGDDQGRTEYRAEIDQAIAAAGLKDRVRIVGHVEDMPAAYAAATLVVSASIEPEAFGRIAVEAAAMSVPVIASDHGGARETVVIEPDNARTGWRVPPGDPAALAAALASALALAPAELTAIGIAGAAFVRRRFSVQAMCRATIETYLRVVGVPR